MIRRSSAAAPARCPAAFIDLAGRLADVAGKVARRYFRTGVTVIGKADASPVTIADREAEARMRVLINRECRDHGIYGEEHGVERVDAEYVWVLDPIDGTKSFISGVPMFGTLIALLRRGEPILGVIDQPILRDRWLGATGHPTRFNGAVARTRACGALSEASLFATTPDMFRGASAASFKRLHKAVKLPRYGTDCYAYGLLASGHVDVVVEARLQPYDYLAQVPIIAGAGGILTDWEGRPLGLKSGDKVCAVGDRRQHRKVLDLLAG